MRNLIGTQPREAQNDRADVREFQSDHLFERIKQIEKSFEDTAEYVCV